MLGDEHGDEAEPDEPAQIVGRESQGEQDGAEPGQRPPNDNLPQRVGSDYLAAGRGVTLILLALPDLASLNTPSLPIDDDTLFLRQRTSVFTAQGEPARGLTTRPERAGR